MKRLIPFTKSNKKRRKTTKTTKKTTSTITATKVSKRTEEELNVSLDLLLLAACSTLRYNNTKEQHGGKGTSSTFNRQRKNRSICRHKLIVQQALDIFNDDDEEEEDNGSKMAVENNSLWKIPTTTTSTRGGPMPPPPRLPILPPGRAYKNMSA